MHCIVSHHLLLRPSRSSFFLNDTATTEIYTDLIQELFVQLLSKNRFEHYLETERTDYEIECEIGQIEPTKLLTGDLRKRHPETYRLARRISTLIQSSSNFRGFDSSGSGDEPHRRLANRVNGLIELSDGKGRRSSHEVNQRDHIISVRARQISINGRTVNYHTMSRNSNLSVIIL